MLLATVVATGVVGVQPVVFAPLVDRNASPNPNSVIPLSGLADINAAFRTLREVVHALNADRESGAPVGIPSLPDNDYGGSGEV